MKIFLAIFVLLLVLGGGGLFLAVGGGGDDSTDGSSGGFSFGFGGGTSQTEVRVEPVSQRELIERIPAPGEIEPHTRVEIASQIVSQITALPFREGDQVAKGDLVVQLDDRDLTARLEASQAALASAEANLEASHAARNRTEASLEEQQERRNGLVTTLDFAQRNLTRKQELYDSGDIPMSELDAALERVRDVETQIAAMDAMISGAESSLAQADADVLRAEAAIKQAQADIKLAEEGLRNTKITSPIDGKVVKLNAEVGETVVTGTMNSPGTVIMTIADLSRMRMVARVDESRIAPVREEQVARVHINSYEDTVFSGVVDRIALQMTRELDGTGFFETEILLRLDGNEIYAGGNANAEIEVAKHTGLVVPSQSIVDRDIEDLPDEVIDAGDIIDRSRRIVRIAFKVVDGKTVATPVRIGPSDLTHTLVLEGLEEGDIVVTGPYKALDIMKHGEAVKVAGASSKPAAASSANAEADQETAPESGDDG